MAGKSSYGIKLYYCGTGTVVSSGTQIAQITGIGGPDIKRDAVDVTDMDSANKFKEFVGGLIDAGSVPIELNYAPTVTTNLITYMKATQNYNYGILLPAGTGTTSTWLVSGFLESLSQPSVSPDGKISQSVSIKISGEPTHAAS